MKSIEQIQTKLVTKQSSITLLFLFGWCCHLLSIVTLLILSGIATDRANGYSLDRYSYTSEDKSLSNYLKTL